MAQDAILKVKEAEDKFAELIKAASERSKAILDSAETEGYDKYKSIIKESNEHRLELIKKAENEAQIECTAITNKGEADIANIRNPAGDKFNNVVSLVMERIVNVNGNS